MAVVGIDFGNDTSCVSVVREVIMTSNFAMNNVRSTWVQDGVETITNDYSFRSTPSYVAFGEKARTMGYAAKSAQITQVLLLAFKGLKTYLWCRRGELFMGSKTRWAEDLEIPEWRRKWKGEDEAVKISVAPQSSILGFLSHWLQRRWKGGVKE